MCPPMINTYSHLWVSPPVTEISHQKLNMKLAGSRDKAVIRLIVEQYSRVYLITCIMQCICKVIRAGWASIQNAAPRRHWRTGGSMECPTLRQCPRGAAFLTTIRQRGRCEA